MKGKHLLILLLLVAVLGYAGYHVQKGNQSSWSESSGSGSGGKVVDFQLNDVTHIQVKTASAGLNLVKKNEEWTVQERGDYPANFEQVSGLLRKLWDLKTVQEVKAGPSQRPRLELGEPGKGEGSGTLVELKDKEGKNLTALLIGKKHMRNSDAGPMGGMGGFPSGRYVAPFGDNTKISLVSETLEEIEPQPERWLRKDFVKIENPKSISLSGQTEAMRWTVTRESATADWKLADAKPEEELDKSKVSQFATLFSSPTFKDVLAADAKPEETGLDKPTTATIETFDGFTYVVKIGKLTNEAYPVQIAVSANLAKERTPGKDEKPEDKTKLDEEFKTKQKQLEEKLAAEKKFEQRAYLLEKYTVEPLLKDRAALLAEKKPDPATTSTPPAPGSAPTATTPPVSVTTPPVSVTTPPVSATTPPVAVPPPQPPPPAGSPPTAVPTTPPAKPPMEPAPANPPATAPPSATPPAPTQPSKPAPNPPAPAPPASNAPAPSPQPPSSPAPASPPPAPQNPPAQTPPAENPAPAAATTGDEPAKP